MASAFLGIGSNVQAEAFLISCASALREVFPGCAFSSVYQTAPRDVLDQPTFLNAAARIETPLEPHELLLALKTIENLLGKKTDYRFGPRTIDLDLLLYDDLVLPDTMIWKLAQTLPVDRQHDPLYLPHLRMHQRRFVLEPLCELMDPEALHPVLQKTWSMLLEESRDQECEKYDLKL